MLFNSLQFLLFFIVVTLTYFLLEHRYRWILLLAASCFFYMSFIPVYILILAFTIGIDYCAGILLEQARGRRRKMFLIMSLVANIGVLVFFKYYHFLNENLRYLLKPLMVSDPIPALKIILPIGLSFHTFQAMSYTIEVYRGRQKAERHFGIYALYVMFYPQLVAGPIERPQNLLPQFHTPKAFDFERFKSGFSLMAFGLFKKVVIADRLGMSVDYSYGHISSQSGLSLLIATVFYGFQIYCDFSGYSDIAIGAARIMGFDLMENFRSPYFSKSVAEFWHRWHISLSTWFRDYLYIPLGGNRVSVPRWFFNLFVVFLISGLWHGAKWTFVAWGAVHGCMLIFAVIRDRLLRRWNIGLLKDKRFSVVSMFITFSMVMLAWVFFRAETIGDAARIFHRIFTLSFHDRIQLYFNPNELLFCVLLIAGLLVREKWSETFRVRTTRAFFLVNTVVLFSCYFFGVFHMKQFIYFQF